MGGSVSAVRAETRTRMHPSAFAYASFADLNASFADLNASYLRLREIARAQLARRGHSGGGD